MTDLQKDLSPETPLRLKKIYAIIFFVAAALSAIAIALAQIPAIANSIHGLCHDTHICGPDPLKKLLPLASGYEQGNTVNRAASGQFTAYARENPDWNICLKNTRSLEKHDWLRRNYRYRMEGEFYAIPKWRSFKDVASDWWYSRQYDPGICTQS